MILKNKFIHKCSVCPENAPGLAIISVICPSSLGDTYICEDCLLQIRITHQLQEIENYDHKGRLRETLSFEDPEPGRENKFIASHWGKKDREHPFYPPWRDFLSDDSQEGFSYAMDQRGHLGDAYEFLFERWSAVAEFFNHHPRPNNYIEG